MSTLSDFLDPQTHGFVRVAVPRNRVAGPVSNAGETGALYRQASIGATRMRKGRAICAVAPPMLRARPAGLRPRAPQSIYHSPMQILRASTVLYAFVLLLSACGTAPSPAPEAAPPSLISAEQSRDAAIHALGLVGTPYRYGGNTVDGGFDCSGLIAFVYRESAGLLTPRTVAQLAAFGEPIARANLRTGDLVVFGGRWPTHAGIYVGEGRFVHAPSTGGEVRLDRLDGSYWSRPALDVRRP